MQTMTMAYEWFTDKYFNDLEPVRGFGIWRVWAARQYHACLLLLVNEIEEIVIKCQYESFEERSEDIELLHQIPPDGEAGAGIFASLKPSPPTLSAGNARSFPKPDSGAGPLVA